ncbi:MAG TPA: SOS response-associated peptidase [Kofleriaceae bacterium]|jgi:putative SOS response-associated peptidase YedK|nr:SOS response-associated peptidase [Kofleriaceae bacterium]
MCGRYKTTRQDQLVAEMELARADDAEVAAVVATAPALPAGLTSWWAPRWNVAPTQPAPIVVMRARPTVTLMRWGLVPHWADDLAIGHRMINARAESLAGKPAFRDALRKRRCLIVADGFYEWRAAAARKAPRQPFLLGPDAGPVTFAGLWDRWRSPAGWIESFTIVTTAAAPLVAPLHDRMPLVIAPADRARWLAADEVPAEALGDLLSGPPLAGWTVTEVEPWINAPGRERGAAP